MTLSASGYIYPLLNICASGACFLSIGFLFGFGHASDTVFLILALQSGIATLGQSTWHVAIPMLYRKKTRRAQQLITTTALINLAGINLIYVVISLVLQYWLPVYFNGFASGFYFFFQIHLFFKNSYLSSGQLNRFYLLDVVGYAFSALYFFALYFSSPADDALVDLLFLGMLCSWLVVVVVDVLGHRESLAPTYSQWFSQYSIRRGLRPRLASLAYAAKDFMVPLALKLFGGDGIVTTYSYANKVAISLYQVVPIHVVNQWFSYGRPRAAVFSFFALNKLALKSLSLYSLAATFIFGAMCFMVKSFGVGKLSTVPQFTLFYISVIVLAWFGVQSYEQAYARAVYLLGAYHVQAKADLANSAVFFFIFGLSFFSGNAVVMLLGTVFSQLCSLWVYKRTLLREGQ